MTHPTGHIHFLIDCFLDDRKHYDFIDEDAKKVLLDAALAAKSQDLLVDAINDAYDTVHRPRGSLVMPWGNSVNIKRKAA